MRNKAPRKQLAYPEPFLSNSLELEYGGSVARDCLLLEHLQNYVKLHGRAHVEKALKFHATLYN